MLHGITIDGCASELVVTWYWANVNLIPVGVTAQLEKLAVEGLVPSTATLGS
jgi:hypothetical protein